MGDYKVVPRTDRSEWLMLEGVRSDSACLCGHLIRFELFVRCLDHER